MADKPSQPGKLSFDDIPQAGNISFDDIPVKKKQFGENPLDYIPTPPTSLNPFESKSFQAAKDIAKQGKDATLAAYDSLTRDRRDDTEKQRVIADNKRRWEILKAGGKELATNIGRNAIEMAPTSPEELAISIGAEALPLAGTIGSATRQKAANATAREYLLPASKVVDKRATMKLQPLEEILVSHPELKAGSKDAVRNKAQFLVGEIERQKQAMIAKASEGAITASSKATIQKKEVLKPIMDMMNDLSSTPGITTDAYNKVERAFNKYAQTLPEIFSPDRADRYKRTLHKIIGNPNFLKDMKGLAVELNEKLATGFRLAIENRTPGIKELNRKQGDLLQIIDSLDSQLNRGSGHGVVESLKDTAKLGAARLTHNVTNLKGNTGAKAVPAVGITRNIQDRLED